MMSGTSMATPFVAGICALMLSEARANNKPMTNTDAFRKRLQDHTSPIIGEGAGNVFFQGFGIISVKDVICS